MYYPFAVARGEKRWEDRKKKEAKEAERETGTVGGGGGGRRGLGAGGNSRGDANLMAAAINNKHRSLIARESSVSLSSFVFLPSLSLRPLPARTVSLPRDGVARLSCIFHLSPASPGLLSPGASLTPFTLQ